MKKNWHLPVFCSLAIVAFVSSIAGADQPKDGTITAKVKLVLLEKIGSDALEIDVDTKDGRVSLSGDVEKRASAELADDLAKSVDGVVAVDNHLTVENATGGKVESAGKEAEQEVKDAILESRVRVALIDAIGSASFDVGTEVASGQVVLKFESEVSKNDRQQAVAAVRALDGVKKVSSIDDKD